jgi:sugar lactone lactonase YvrE
MANDKDFKVKNGIQPTVYHEKIGTVTSQDENYSILGAYYTGNVTASLAAYEATPVCLFFKPDGTELYIGGFSDNSIDQYTLSTAFSLPTAAHTRVQSLGYDPRGLFFKSDGLTLYVVDYTADAIKQYSLSTAWDISTIGTPSTFSVASQTANPTGLTFKPDGTKMHVSCLYGVTTNFDGVFQYSLSTAWDVTSASYDNKSFDMTNNLRNVVGHSFNSDGTKMFVITQGGVNGIYDIPLTTPYDISTAVDGSEYTDLAFGSYLNLSGKISPPQNFVFNSDGTKFYIVSSSSDVVYEFSSTSEKHTLDLSTGSVFEITPTDNSNIILSNPEASGTISSCALILHGGLKGYIPTELIYDSTSLNIAVDSFELDFSPDNSKMYVLEDNLIRQYSLPNAPTVTGAIIANAFSFTQETFPRGFCIKPDGTKFYVTGWANDTVYQYSMSTAYDISTASYENKSFSLSTQVGGGAPEGVKFKPDGTVMFVLDNNTNKIFQYSLSTAWDVSTASYDNKFFATNSQTLYASSFDFSEDGTVAFIMPWSGSTLYAYNLSTAWDISTMTYVGTGANNNVSGQIGTGTDRIGIRFTKNGEKLYILKTGGTNSTIYQYTVSRNTFVEYPPKVEFDGGSAFGAPSSGETDVILFSTRDGGTSYQSKLAIDGAA